MDNCSNCNDTGRNPGSEYLDCTYCDTAKTRSDLNQFVMNWAKDYGGVPPIAIFELAWAVHQRAISMAQAKKEQE